MNNDEPDMSRISEFHKLADQPAGLSFLHLTLLAQGYGSEAKARVEAMRDTPALPASDVSGKTSFWQRLFGGSITQMKLYKSDAHGFQVTYPSPWNVLAENNDDVAVVLGDPQSQSNPQVSIWTIDMPVVARIGNNRVRYVNTKSDEAVTLPESIDDYCDLRKEIMRKSIDGWMFLASDKFELAGAPALRIVYACLTQRALRWEAQITRFHPTTTFLIKLGVQEPGFAEISPLFQRIAASFKLIDCELNS